MAKSLDELRQSYGIGREASGPSDNQTLDSLRKQYGLDQSTHTVSQTNNPVYQDNTDYSDRNTLYKSGVNQKSDNPILNIGGWLKDAFVGGGSQFAGGLAGEVQKFGEVSDKLMTDQAKASIATKAEINPRITHLTGEQAAQKDQEAKDFREYLQNTAADAQQNIVNREAFGGGWLDNIVSQAAPSVVSSGLSAAASAGLGLNQIAAGLSGGIKPLADNATKLQKAANAGKNAAAQAISMIPFGASASGNSYSQARNAGYGVMDSAAFSSYEGLKEVGTELMFNTIGIMSKLNQTPTDRWAEVVQSALYKAGGNNHTVGRFLSWLGKMAVGGMEEGTEEVVGDFADLLVPLLFGKDMADDLVGDIDIVNDFIVGFASGIMGEGPAVIGSNAVNQIQQYNQNRAVENSVVKSLTEEADKEKQTAAIRTIIQSGLENAPDTKAYKTASQLKERMDAGETPTVKEAGYLAAQNNRQLQKEVDAQVILHQIAADKTGLSDFENYRALTNNKEAMSSLGVNLKDNVSNSQRRNDIAAALASYGNKTSENGLASQNKASGAAQQTNTVENGKTPENANYGAVRSAAYSYVQNAAIREGIRNIDGAMGREVIGAMYNESTPAYQYLSDAEKIYNAAVSGKEASNLYGALTEEQIEYIKTAAQSDVKAKENAKENKKNGLPVQEGKERNAGKGSEGRKEAAGESGKTARDVEASKVTVVGKATRENLKLDDLSDSSTAELVKFDETATKDMRMAKMFLNAMGIPDENIFFVKGQLVTSDGAARGLHTGDGRIYIQIDDVYESAYKLARHEYCHEMLQKNGWNAKEIVDILKSIKGMNEETIQAMCDEYVNGYADEGVTDVNYILEELICDMYAGINQFTYGKLDIGLVPFYRPVSSAIQRALSTRAGPDTISEQAQATYTPVKHSIAIADRINETSIEKAKKQYEAGKIAFTSNLVEAVGKDIADLINGKPGRKGYSLNDLSHMVDKNGMSLLPEESSFTNNIFSNSSYLKDAEPTTECYRHAVYKALANRVSDILGRPLSYNDSMIVNQAAIEIGIDAPCIYCYSLLDRKAKEAYKLQYVAERDAFMQYFDSEYHGDKAAFIADMKKNFDRYYQMYLSREIDPSGGSKRADNQKKIAEGKQTSKGERVQLWMDMYAYLYGEKTGVLSLNNIRNAVAEEETRGKFKDIKDAKIRSIKENELDDLQYWVQSSSQAKKIIPYSAYSNLGRQSILNWKKIQIDALNGEYGLRWYSHADYHPAFIIDNIQQITDAAIMGLKGLMYVKPVEAAKVFAPTGMNINVSCFAQYVNGEYVMDDRLGANWDEVKNLRNQYGNVGAVMVATSDDMVLWALSQDWVDVVIPLHMVRSGTEFFDAFGLNNYSSEQADKITDKDKYEAYIAALSQEQSLTEKQTNKLKKDKKSIYPVEHQNDYDRYMGIVNERGITPRFNRIREAVESGISYKGTQITPAMYMKLVNETRQSEAQTQKLKPVFDFNAAWDSIQDLTNKGYYDYFKESSDWNGKKMTWEDWAKQAAADAEANKAPNELGYGRELAVNEEGRWIIPKSSAQAKKAGVGGVHSNAKVRASQAIAPTFFLKSEQLIREIKGEKIGASSIIPYLKGKGVKDEEIRWTGIQQFVEGKKSVSKTELADFIRDNDFQYTIEQRGFQGDEAKVKQLRKEVRDAKAKQRQILDNVRQYQFEDAKQWVLNHVPDWDGYHLSEISENPMKGSNPIGSFLSQMDRLTSYWLREGNDWSLSEEWKESDVRRNIEFAQHDYFDALMAERNAREEAEAESKNDNSKWSKYKLSGGSNYRELLVNRPGSTYSNPAMNVHWGSTGVLAHARIQDMKTKDKQNMLFVEEIQSDWHNQGHKEGYTDVDTEQLKRDRTKAERAIFDRVKSWGQENDRDVVIAAKKIGDFFEDNGRYYNPNVIIDDLEHDPILFFGKEAVYMEEIEPGSLERVIGKESLELFESWKDEYESLENAAKEIRKKQNDIKRMAPEAPFAKTYTDFVMKLLIREAAENGYDSIGWTASEQQLKRWNAEGATNAQLQKQGYAVTFAEGAENEVAFKKGYEKEYDQDIPGFMKKYVKQWGSQVTVSELKNGEKVWSVPITESMRNDVLTKGQPKYSLALVPKIEPTADHSWKPSLTTEEVMKVYPDLWNVAAEESEDRNPTQITSTVSTYRKIYDILKSEGFTGKILDASSGRGFGTQAGINEYGFDVDDIEPFADSAYALGSPKYTDYSTLNEKYDAIISNAVLNVLPGEQRDALVVKMGQMLNPGGRMFINVRSLGEIQNLQKAVDKKTGKLKNVKLSESEVAETTHGSYQKGFTKTELNEYLTDALGAGFKVENTSKFGGTSVIVTKTGNKYSKAIADINKQYMALAKINPELHKESLDEMVREAATAAGYTSEKLYHGTDQFGFTKIDLSKVDDGISFFATNSEETANSYSHNSGERSINSLKNPNRYEDAEVELSVVCTDLAEVMNEIAGVDNYIDEYDIMDAVTDALRDEYEFSTEEIHERLYDALRDYFDNLYYDYRYEDYDSTLDFEASSEFGKIDDVIENMEKAALEYVLAIEDKNGNYSLYANTDGFYEIDAKNHPWSDIPYERNGKMLWGSTRHIAKLLKGDGVPGIIFHNLLDDGGRGDIVTKPADVYIFFNPNEQVKSADTVTYDNNGEIIPLTERFNKKNDDIRYSKSIVKYTEQQYNGYGWATENRVLKKVEHEDWKSKLSALKGNLRFVKADSGSIIIPVGNEFGINNVLVYTRGTYENPEIEKVVRINPSAYGRQLNDDELDATRREIYNREKQHNWDAAEIVEGFFRKGYIRIYRPEMFAPYEAYERAEKGKTRIGNRTLTRYVDGRRVKYEDRYDDKTGELKWTFREGEGYTRYSKAIGNPEYRRLNRKYDAAVKLAEYWKAETKTSVPHIRDIDIERFGKNILKNYSSTLKYEDIKDELTACVNRFTLSPISDRDAVEMAYPLAKKIIESASELVNDYEYQQFKDIKKWLKGKTLYVTAAQSQDIPDFSAWKKQNRWLNVKFGQTGNVDQVYSDLRAAFPDLKYTFFPEVNSGAGDQLMQIVESMESLNAVYDNPFSREMGEAIQGLAEEIFESSFDAYVDRMLKEAPPTFADKQKAKIDKLKEQIEENRKEAIDDRRSIRHLETIRRNRDAQIQEMKDSIVRQRIRRAESKQRQRLLKIARRVSNMKLPKVSRELRDQFLSELDLVAVSLTGDKARKLQHLKEVYEGKFDPDSEYYDPDYIRDTHIENNLSRLTKVHISDLTSEQIQYITEVLLYFESMERNKRKLINSKMQYDTNVAGNLIINDIRNSAGTKESSIWDKYIVSQTLSPEREVHRVTGYNDNDPLYVAMKEVSDGQREMFRYQNEAESMFDRFLEDKEFIKGFTGKDAKLITVIGHDSYGKKVEVQITPAMRASLYLHYQAEQNLRHVATGGVEVPNAQGWELYRKGKIKEAWDHSDKVIFSKTQVEAIISKMTAKEKAFADQAHYYFNEVSNKAINDTSEALKGYSIANVENYFPIQSDPMFLTEDFSRMSDEGVIESMGFTKDRVQGATNPIMLYDLNTVLTRSIAQHAKYVGLAIPVRNFNLLWNAKNGYNKESMKKEMQNKWTSRSIDYITGIMQDVQGMASKRDKAFGDLLAKVRSNYAGAVLTLNAGVAFKQTASFFTAASTLGWKPVMEAFPEFVNCIMGKGTVNTKEISKYTPLWDHRMSGFTDQELGELTSAGKKLPAALNWIQYMDGATTRALWKAAENKVLQDNPGKYNVNSAEFKAKVAEVYNKTIEETQPNYTMMQRPAVLRSKDELVKTLNMFKTQPFQNFNVLYDAIGNYNAKKNAVANSRSDETIKALAEAKTTLGNAVSGQIASALAFTMLQYVWDLVRGRGANYSDGDDEPMEAEDFLAWLKKISTNMASSVFGIMPFVSILTETSQMIIDKMVKGFGGSPVFGGTYYGLEVSPVNAINNTAKAVGKLVENSGKLLTGNQKSTADTLKSLTNSIADVMEFFGIPAGNVQQILTMPFKWFGLDLKDFID